MTVANRKIRLLCVLRIAVTFVIALPASLLQPVAEELKSGVESCLRALEDYSDQQPTG